MRWGARLLSLLCLLLALGAPASRAAAPSALVGGEAARAEAQGEAPHKRAERPLRPVLFKAEDADSTIWFLGSVHVLRPGTLWRTPVIDSILDAAEAVYFETSLQIDPREAFDSTIRYGSDRGVKDLSYRMSREGWRRLVALVKESNQHLGQYYYVRPWFAKSMLERALNHGFQVSKTQGVDLTMAREARRRGKEIRHLETLEDQVKALAAESDDEALAGLEAFVENVDEHDPAGQFDRLVDSWRYGDDEALAELVREGIAGALYDALLVGRNSAWVEKIKALMDGSGTYFIVVGAGHLVGEHSVPTMLRQAGITVTRQ